MSNGHGERLGRKHDEQRRGEQEGGGAAMSDPTGEGQQPGEEAVEPLEGPEPSPDTPETAEERSGGHWSDCSWNSTDPALPSGPCDCGGRPAREIVAAITGAFPHVEPCTFPDRDCHCGAAEIRCMVVRLIADLGLVLPDTAEPEPEPTKVRRRPHWLPEEAWLGVIVGQWPLQAFASQEQAERWAANAKWEPERQAHEQRRIWRVEIPVDTQTFKVEAVPASTRLIEAPW